MSRNGPIGQPAPRLPARRSPADEDQYANGQSGWPPSQPSHFGPAPDQHGYPQHHAGGHQHQHPQHSQGYYFPDAPEQNQGYGYPQQPGGQALPFDRFPPAAPRQQQPAQQWDAPHDAGHYDLGSYEPRGYGQSDPPPFAASADGPFRHHYGAPQEQHGYAEQDEDYDDLLDEEEEPRRGRRGLVIAGALVGAISLGGAMAYGYKTYIATPSRAPVVKVTDNGPTKVRPALPGGKEFAHTDKKLLNRVDDESSSPQRSGDDRIGGDPNAPRMVRSIPISPAGQMPPASAPASSSPTVPGIMLDNMGPPPAAPQRVQIPSAPPPPAPPRAETAAMPPPVRVVAPAPPPALPPAAPVAEAPPPARKVAAAVPVAVAPPPVREAAPVRAAAPVSAPVATASTSGYVAVLSSQKSRMDALKAFADIQQKYGDVLSSKTPDVQEANLGDKGVWYRAVVGPPVSRDAASGICSQLKSAGYSGCWVTAY